MELNCVLSVFLPIFTYLEWLSPAKVFIILMWHPVFHQHVFDSNSSQIIPVRFVLKHICYVFEALDWPATRSKVLKLRNYHFHY